jgi:hypothetical protein
MIRPRWDCMTFQTPPPSFVFLPSSLLVTSRLNAVRRAPCSDLLLVHRRFPCANLPTSALVVNIKQRYFQLPFPSIKNIMFIASWRWV